jgi:predicted RNA binding protein YcfA (HicA-like mRNA interferase family)
MSARLPALKSKDVFRALNRAGFYLHHTTGSHYYLKHPENPACELRCPGTIKI